LVWVLPAAIMSIPALFKMSSQSNKATRWLALLFSAFSSLLIGGVLLLTQSRTAYLSIGITLFAMILFLLPKKWRWVVGGLAVLGLAAFFIWISQVGFETVIHTTLDNVPLGVEKSSASLISMQGRVEIWSRAIMLIREVPLTGLGLNVFRYAIFLVFPPYSIGPEFNLGHAHNEMLQTALDLGIPGLIAFVTLSGIAFFLLLRSFYHPSHPGKNQVIEQFLVLGLAGGLAAHFLYGLLDTVALGAKPGFLFWMLLGLTAGYAGCRKTSIEME
jgi:putative inorganic carbon (hco3(-)) transporter